MEAEKNEQTFPSVELAYPIAIASYELAQKRLDIIDSRLQTVIASGTTVSLAIPVLASAKGLSFSSLWFIAAVCVFFSAVILGTLARITGNIIVLNPARIYKDWLGFSEWEFKKNLIFFAGQHFESNRNLAKKRGWLTTITVALFIIEGLLLSVWASLPHP